MVFAFVLELTCRVEDWVTYRAPLLSRYTSINDLMAHDADGMHGRPNARYLKWEMNALGMRGPSASPTPAPGTIRVITVGASETFGLRESPGTRVSAPIEDSVNARISRGECGAKAPAAFEVLNAGFAGMGLPTIEQDLRMRIQRLAPTVIVIYPTPAQYLQDEVPFAARPDSAARVGEPSLVHALRPRTIERVRDQIKQVLPEWVKTRLRQIQTREMLRYTRRIGGSLPFRLSASRRTIAIFVWSSAPFIALARCRYWRRMATCSWDANRSITTRSSRGKSFTLERRVRRSWTSTSRHV